MVPPKRQTHSEDKEPKRPSKPEGYLKYANLAIQMVLTLGLAGWLGFWLDKKLQLVFPAFLLTFVMIAFCGMIYKLYRSIDK